MTTQIPPMGQSGQSDGGASGATEQAKEKAQQATEQARGRLRDQVDQRSTEYGEKVSSQASDARSVADELRKQGKDQPAKVAEQAADKAEQLGGYLQRADADQILRDVEDFGRRRPWAVVAGGLALGFAASRFLKASSTERSRGASRPELSSGGGVPEFRPMPDAGRSMPGTTGGL